MLSKFLNSRNGEKLNRALAFMLVFTLTFANYMFIGMYFAESSISYAKEEKEVKVELEQGFKTNKVYEFEEAFKRIVQLEVTSEIENAEGSAEIVIPETVIENKEAMEIKAVSYDTEFAFKNNTLSFETKEVNSFTITYIYEEEATYNDEEEKYEFNEEPELEAEEIMIKVKSEKDETISAKAEKVEYTNGIQFGDIVVLTDRVSNIYKGNMYLNEDTEYSKNIEVEVKSLQDELFEENFVISSNEKVLKEQGNDETEEIISEEVENSIYYKSTTFSKKELTNLFGQESSIIITAKTNETEKNTIILFSEYDEEEYKDYEIIDITKISEDDEEIIIEHDEGTTEVIIETSIPEKEGIFNIKHNKEIRLNENVDIEKINKLDSEVSLVCGEESNYTVNAENNYEIKEPTTKANLSMEFVNSNQTVLSSLIDNEVNFTVNLFTNGPEYKLYKNPVIKITLPSTVKVDSIKDIALALDDGLTIKNSSIIDNAIIVELEGEQKAYNFDEMQQSISVGAVLKVGRTTPSGEVEIISTCKNGEDEEISLEAVKANVFSPAELISVTDITVNEQVATSIEENNTIKINTFAENTVANVDVALINNHGNTISGLKIEGSLSGEGTTFSTKLVEAIKLSGLGCEVEYFDGENKVEDIATAKTFVISIDEMKHGEALDISYQLSIPENLPYNENLFTTLNMEYTYEGKACEKDLNMQITTGKGPSAKFEIVPEVENEVLNGGQIVTYNIKVINDGDENIPEAVFSYEIFENAKIIEFIILQGSIFEYVEDEDNKKEWNIKDFATGEEVEAKVTVKIDNIEKETNFVSKANLTQGEKVIALEEIKTKVIPADFEIVMTTYLNNEGSLDVGDIMQYRIESKNVSEEALENAVITTYIPEHTEFVKAYFYDEKTDNIEEKNYKYENGIVTYNVDKIEKNQVIVTVLEVKVKELPEELNNEAKLKNYAVVEAKNNKCQSNIIEHTVHTADFEIHMDSDAPVTLNVYDDIEYNITVTNTGKRNSAVKIEDCVPDIVSVNKISYYENEENINNKYTSGSDVELFYPLEVGKTINVKIEGVISRFNDNETQKTINNVAKVNLGNGSYVESEVVTNIVNNNLQEQLKEENNDSSNPNVENEKTATEKTYSILGLAWLDENEDGKKDSTEKVLEGIEVLLVNANTGEVIENVNKEKMTTKTSKDGAYNFEGLKNGDYKVIFKYNSSKYQTTIYQKEGINASVNSDATMQNITINGESQKVGLTNTITIKDSSIVNIDLGLKENNTFDLSLKKQIKKVTVKNSAGTKEYDFTNTNFAKIEIDGKHYKGSTLVIEYELIIANEGDVTAYVTDILDYMPRELNFNSEMNTNWYADSAGVLHDIALSMDELEPGKQLTEKLVLTTTIDSDKALTIKNIAEIGSAINAEGLEEKDSTPSNKKDGEDDIEQAELIVSIKTGGTWMYIGITLLSLIIITVGIYLVNKKVLKGII